MQIYHVNKELIQQLNYVSCSSCHGYIRWSAKICDAITSAISDNSWARVFLVNCHVPCLRYQLPKHIDLLQWNMVIYVVASVDSTKEQVKNEQWSTRSCQCLTDSLECLGQSRVAGSATLYPAAELVERRSKNTAHIPRPIITSMCFSHKSINYDVHKYKKFKTCCYIIVNVTITFCFKQLCEIRSTHYTQVKYCQMLCSCCSQHIGLQCTQAMMLNFKTPCPLVLNFILPSQILMSVLHCPPIHCMPTPLIFHFHHCTPLI